VTVIIDSGKPTPEAQLRSFNDRFNPKHQKLIRSGLLISVVQVAT
jgi:hypothetical protein